MTAQERARRLGGSFGHLTEATPNSSGHQRLQMAEHLTDQRWADGWARVAEQLEGERQGEGVLAFRSRRQPQLNTGTRRIEPTIGRAGAGDVREDVLEAIPPPEYVEALTGEVVPAPGGAINCPLPGHDDRTPSCHVYAEPGRGWYCHGCHRGGGAIDLAAYITGIEPRGSGYVELRKMVAEKLLGAPR